MCQSSLSSANIATTPSGIHEPYPVRILGISKKRGLKSATSAVPLQSRDVPEWYMWVASISTFSITHDTHASVEQMKKLCERVILAEKSLWLLSAVLHACCSDYKIHHEDCLESDLMKHKNACHIWQLTWRIEDLTNIFILIDQYKAWVDTKIPKPAKASSFPKVQASAQNDGEKGYQRSP